VSDFQPPIHSSVPLSPAEQTVVAEVCQGLTNREIGERLGKSEFTVKNQVSTILRKLALPSRARLIAHLR
jgi:DNA-binding NarL/FixJ family response regulator